MGGTIFGDGFYVNHAPSKDFNKVFRFYNNGEVIVGGIQQNHNAPGITLPSGNWFRNTNSSVTVGTFRVVGQHIIIEYDAPKGHITYTGEIAQDGLGLALSSTFSEGVETFFFYDFECLPDYIP